MKPAIGARSFLLLALALFACAGARTRGEEIVTEHDLLANERFWPYRVALTAPWPGAGGEIPPGTTGVLIRVEPSGQPRIDFGSRGKYEIPVRATDLVERANRIRTGALAKPEPNFVHAIKTRMVDPGSEGVVRFPPERVARYRGFLCVFADPDAADFAEIARSLAPLRERAPVLTILFAQGHHPDERLRERLRALDWSVPFLHDFLSEPYTRSLLAEGTRLPALLLHTAEGRVVYAGAWEPNAVSDLIAAWDRAFPLATRVREGAGARSRNRHRTAFFTIPSHGSHASFGERG